ncbi:HMG box-containing protein 4 isoform X1 [Lutzomyia longipalpis]|uniref:Putative hmg box-containing protein 4 n=1 Tax=Lutzomyia longipalpis TaxID=7200 RepID=A0A1B0CR62_LUTLO|nr:HMG box-containing protein 4 isoform X1 [Lutzomyia longipalpis]
MESTPSKQEGAAVSRSGRVLKKSSKLMDFQSPEDMDGRYKRTSSHKTPRSHNTSYRAESMELQMSTPYAAAKSEILSDPEMDVSDANTSGGKEMMEVERYNDVAENYQDSAPSKSIYMTEKSTKKKVMKDGRLVLTKAQRKDKGKSRYTAYMLWAKDVRQELLYSHPALDFATISRRLGEMWANVPSNVKFNWRRKAKRLAAKGTKPDKSVLGYKRANSKFLNKNSPAVSKGATNAAKTLIKAPHRDSDTDKSPPMGTMVKSITTSHVYRVNTSHPLDVAAHLKLLGDNLMIIGQRLKEHEGQIAVSGSLSVLLDSLLCSLGPLMCLTVHIPGIGDHLDDLKLTLHNTLDNIAYVMPGL